MHELYSIGLRPAFFVPLIVLFVFAAWGTPMLMHGKRLQRQAIHDKKGYFPEWEGEGYRTLGYVALSLAGVVALVASLMFIPYEWKYAQMYRVSGEVTRVSNVFQDASGQVTGTPVVELDSLDVPVEVENQRAVGLEGKDVTLTCTLNWRYAAADRLVCDLFEVTSHE